jgi:hypothetical protein
MNIIIWIVLGIIGGYIFTKLQSKVVATWKALIEKKVPEIKVVEDKITAECTVIKEKFCWSKLWNGIISLRNPTLWAKEFSWLFNLRKLVIVGVIIGVIYGVGYFRGVSGKPVFFNMQGKQAMIKLNDHYLRIDSDGSAHVLDKDMKTVLKDIKVKDIPGLRESLRPFGFRLKPFFTAGGGVGEKKKGFEAGLGLDFFRFYRSNANVWLTNLGGYVGIGYQITDNFDALVGVGKGFSGDNRAYIGGKFRF